MTIQDVRTLLDYHYWAHHRMLDALDALDQEQFTRDLGSSFKSIRETVAHTYSAEWAWYQRWQGTSPSSPPPLDQFPDVAAIRRQWADLEAKTRAFFDGLDEAGIARAIDYTLLSGAAGSTPVGQMLQHVVNHGSYHRGQVTTMLRQIGAAPPQSMDLIRFYRTRS